MTALRWIFGLFALSALLSQSLMDLFSTVFCLTAIGLAVARRENWTWKDVFPKLGAEWIWIGWFLAVALSFALNAAPEAPWLRRLVEFKWILILYPMAGYLRRDFPATAVLRIALPALLVIDAYTISAFFHGADWITGSADPGRAGGPFADPMTYAHSTAMVVCLLGGLVLIPGSVPTRFRNLLRITFVATAVCVMLTFTRGVWAGLFLGGIITGFLYKPRLGVVLLAAGSAAAALLFAVWERFRERILLVFSSESYDNERWTLWKTNFVIWKENPLLGLGYGENSRRLREYYDRLGVPQGFFEGHAHNQYLHLAAGTGLVGLGFYLAAFGFFVLWNFRLAKAAADSWTQGLLWGALAAQISFLIGGLTEANFEHSKVRFVVMFIWALIAAAGSQMRSRKTKTS